MAKRATTLKELFGNFEHERYLDEDSKEFYVNLYEDELKRFIATLKNNHIPSKSFL